MCFVRLPFEETWFRQQGCRATFVGHPFFDEVRRHRLDEAFMSTMREKPGRLVAILPGSRTQEVQHNLKWFLDAAALVHVRFPGIRFAVAAFKPQHAQMAKRLIELAELPVEVYLRKTQELIQLADCCMACSGSVSLELLYHKKPTVVMYRISPIAYFVQSFFRRVKYITLVNLLTAKELFPADTTPYNANDPASSHALFPEYLTYEDKSLTIASHLIQWLTNDEQREGLVAELAKLKAKVGHGGASRMAAGLILQAADESHRAGIPKPHFVPGKQVISSGGADADLATYTNTPPATRPSSRAA